VAPIASLHSIVELNIGHSIVSQALFDGFAGAVAKMKALMMAARA
jgi:pyridoxine 5-phosphate synthase